MVLGGKAEIFSCIVIKACILVLHVLVVAGMVLAKSVFLVYTQSGKLVTKMFQKVQELIDYKDALVFVLIDEVNKSAFIQRIPLPVLFFLLKGTYRKAPLNPFHRILLSNNDILQNNSVDHVTCRTPFILCSRVRGFH